MEWIYRFFSFINIDQLTRWLISSNRVPILVYHNPKVEVFQKHIDYLSQHYRFIPLPLLVAAIHQKDWSKIPENSMVLTFDDGHADNFSLLPIFKKHQIQPTIFLCTQIVGTNRKYWFMEVPKREKAQLKKVKNQNRLKALKETYDFCPKKEFLEDKRAALSRADIEDMLPYVHFGNHTQFHPILPNLEVAELHEELVNARTDLKAMIPYALDHVAFPNGDYTDREIAFLSQNGFQSGRTTKVGWNSMHTNPYALKVNAITDTASLAKMKFQLSGLFGFFQKWKEYFE